MIYINASRVVGSFLQSNCSFIATQSPLPETISHFWLMVAQHRVKCIVMLTNVDFANAEKFKKCHLYWPSLSDIFLSFPEFDLKICIEKETFLSDNNRCSGKNSTIIERLFKVYYCSEEPLQIVHYQYTGWPDHSIPHEPNDIDLLLRVTEPYCDNAVVHCSAGVGRTGTFCAIQHILQAYKLNRKDFESFSVEQIVSFLFCIICRFLKL